MTVAWTDFLVIAAVANELFQAISLFTERGKKHEDVRIAAEKYRRYFMNPAFHTLKEEARIVLKFVKQLRCTFNLNFDA